MFIQSSPIQNLTCEKFSQADLTVCIKRDEFLHPIVSGNKWRKLKYFFSSKLPAHIISFGGAYSNHIHALSYLAAELNIPLTLYIRGEERWLEQPDTLSPTLADCLQVGAQLKFLDRQSYRLKDSIEFKQQVLKSYPADTLWIAEGGCDKLALQGVAELLSEQQNNFDYIICPVGSATTLAGLITAAKPNQTVIGIAALKQAEYLRTRIAELAGREHTNWQLLTDFNCGGFGKINHGLLELAHRVYQQHAITLDPIYTSKMWFAFEQLLEQGHFQRGSKVMLLHTGGLQGWRGLLQQGLVTNDYLSQIGLPLAD